MVTMLSTQTALACSRKSFKGGGVAGVRSPWSSLRTLLRKTEPIVVWALAAGALAQLVWRVETLVYAPLRPLRSFKAIQQHGPLAAPSTKGRSAQGPMCSTAMSP